MQAHARKAARALVQGMTSPPILLPGQEEVDTVNISDIVALAKAGFTAAQIAAMAQPVAQPVAQPAAQPVAFTDPVLAQLAALTTAINSNAIMNTNMPKAQTADEILAEIINPPTK